MLSIMSRIIATELGEHEGWRIVVENKPGAIQTIGAAEVLKHPADGYTILAIALPATAAPALLPNVGFRLDAHFAPVIKLTVTPTTAALVTATFAPTVTTTANQFVTPTTATLVTAAFAPTANGSSISVRVLVAVSIFGPL